MRRTFPFIPLLLAALLALATSATAQAASPGQIIRDCTNSETGYLTGNYTKGDLRRAFRAVRGDIAEYTGCYDAIRVALASSTTPRTGSTGDDSSGGDASGGGDTSGGGSFGGDVGGTTGGGAGDTSGGSSDDDDEVVVAGGAPDVAVPDTPQAGSDRAVELAGATIQPGALPSISEESNELPVAMTVFLVLLGVGALAAVATTIGRRVLARRRA